MMNSKGTNYVVSFKACCQQVFLLWQDVENLPSAYVLRPDTSRFLSGKTREELLDSAVKFGLHVSEQETAAVDVDRTFKVLTALRPGRLSSTRTCQFLLNGWNTLEDMARPLGIGLNNVNSDEREILQKAYHKLFYGNNLPAVTPNDQSYSPLFSSTERKAMRTYLQRLWREIIEKSGIAEAMEENAK